jgi:hypothetical protein
MQLPKDENIDIALLSSVFNNTSATYKYYWFLAILNAVEEGKELPAKKDIFCKMIVNAWYTVNYFHVSFGKQDKIQEAIEAIITLEKIDIDESPSKIYEKICFSENSETRKIMNHFDQNVPHKFLSPWLGSGSVKDIYHMSQENYALPPYALHKDYIIIQPAWFEYFNKNLGLLKSFCYWHLARFLQVRNPNVPDITGKLIRPERRGSLFKHKKEFWDIVIEKQEQFNCIYTKKPLYIGTYDIEHFIPFQFVAHDLMWNLLPASPSFNRQKGDKLPSLEKYFTDFYLTQKKAIEIIKERNEKNTFLEHYLTIFPNFEISEEKYKDCIQPLITIASNNGFNFMT